MNTISIQDAIFNFAYHEALNDATLQSAYIGNKASIENITEAKKAVKAYIDSIINNNSVKEEDFYDVAKKVGKELKKKGIVTVVDGCNPKSAFCFGNIQKLINMTVKYIFISCYSNIDLRSKFINCHCPMDSKMLEKVWKRYKKLPQNEESLLITCKKTRSKSLSGVYWSQIGFESTEDKKSIDIYKNFQKMVKKLAENENCLPVEYDFNEWPMELE